MRQKLETEAGPAPGEASPRGAEAGPPPKAFAAACDERGVPAHHRRALWELASRWRRTGLAPDERIAATLDDYDHWRLFQRSRGGDAAASRAFERHWTRYIGAFLGSLAADRALEVRSVFFERVYRLLGPEFHWNCPFGVYLRSALVNVLRDERRRAERRRRREVPLEDVADRAGEADLSPEAAVLRDERCEAVRLALCELKPLDQVIVRECLIEGTSGQELAATLAMKPNALYQRLFRARRQLEQAFARRGLSETGPIGGLKLETGKARRDDRRPRRQG